MIAILSLLVICSELTLFKYVYLHLCNYVSSQLPKPMIGCLVAWTHWPRHWWRRVGWVECTEGFEGVLSTVPVRDNSILNTTGHYSSIAAFPCLKQNKRTNCVSLPWVCPVYLIWIVHVPYSFIYACWYTACDPVYRCGIVPHNWLFVHLCLLWTGSLFHTRCTECGHVEENTKSPLCPALKGKGYTVQIFCMHMVLSNLSSS